jgi:methionyl-tRNA formyltransferase
MDTGPIYQRVEMEMPRDVSSDQLFDILAEFGVDPVLKTLDQISSGDLPVPQSEDGATRALKLTKEEGRIDWSASALEISRKISAFNSNPGAWSQFRGETIKVNRVSLSDKSLAAGSLQIIEKSVYVGTATTALQILEVTPSGKAKMDAISWSNGARISPSDELV